MFKNDNVEIQAQDGTGNWRTFSYALNNSQRIVNEMRQLSNNYPNARVRAVDSNGRIVDIL
jgi:hypothetical protein